MAWKAEQAEQQRMYPLDAPGIARPGPSFIDYAVRTGDLKLTEKQQKALRGAKVASAEPIVYGEALEKLMRQCLYSRGELMMPVLVKQGRRRALNVLSGHIWGSRDGHGPERADVMLIGKVHGEEARNNATVFCETSAKLLRELCDKHGLESDKFYVTNLVKTEHPDGGNGWSVNWVKDWLPLLHQEIRLVRPKYILALGADVCQALLGKTDGQLKNVEGRVIDYRYCIDKHHDLDSEPQYRTAKLMGCVNPSAVLRMPETLEKLDGSIARFGQLIRGMRWDRAEDDIDHRTIDTLPELKALAREIRQTCERNMVSIDAEWHGEHPQNEGSYLRTIQLSWRDKTAACIALTHPGGKRRFKGSYKAVARILNQILQGRIVVGQYLAADAEWLIPFGVDIREHYRVPATWQEFREAVYSGKPSGFDTGLAEHAHDETADFGLNALTMRHTSAPRYDIALEKWKHKYCLKHKMKDKDLEGYGMCPSKVLEPYGNYDADVTRRIALAQLARLDADRFGNCCWEAFWRNMRAYQAVMEINMTGIEVDRRRLDALSELYVNAKAELRQRMQKQSRWPTFNLESPFAVREWLYGEKYNGKKRTDPEVPVRMRPKKAKSLYLTPIMTNDKRPMLWDDVIERGLEKSKTPGTKGQILSLLQQNSTHVVRYRRDKRTGRRRAVTVDYSDQIAVLREYRFISQVLKLTLRPPARDDDGDYVEDDNGDYTYEAGLPSLICDDNRLRTHIYPTLETCRWASSRPNLTNVSKRREKDYKRILGDKYRWPIRTIFRAPKGYVLIEADFIGAELLGAAIMSGDAAMIEHCRRNQLPESHPDYYDIHSHVAIRAFRLQCPPTKAGLDSIGKSNLRIVAKAVIFGLMYGRGAKAIAVQAQEERIPLTREEAQKIIDTIFEMYPDLGPFFAECRARAVDPGWLCNCFGQFRRFPTVREEKQVGDFERQAMNFPMQSMVAAAMSQALDNLLEIRRRHPLGDKLFRIVLQIHDAVLLLVPARHVATVVDKILPRAMCKGVPIYRTYLDGMPADNTPYHMGVDTNVYVHWGENLMPDQCEELGIDPKYAGFHPAPDGEGWVHKEMKAGSKWHAGKWVPLVAA